MPSEQELQDGIRDLLDDNLLAGTQNTKNHFVVPPRSSGSYVGIQKKKDSEQIAQSPFQMERYGRDQKSEEIDDSSKWAMRDS